MSARRSILFVVVQFVGVIFAVATALAVVNDVTISGLPEEQTFTIVNTKTGDKQEGKTNKEGVLVLVIPANKNWDAGSHYSLQGGGRPSRVLTLKDGSTAINLAGGGATFGANHVLELELGSYFPDGAQKDVGPSFMFRLNYTAPIRLCCDNSAVNVMPYLSFVGVPDMTTPSVKRLDFNGLFQAEVENAHKYGVRGGAKVVAPLAQIGNSTLVGVGQLGIGAEYSSADLHRFSNVSPLFRDTRNFDKTSWGFLFDLQAGLSIRCPGGFFGGIRGGLVPLHDDWLNGRAKFRTHGELGLIAGFAF